MIDSTEILDKADETTQGPSDGPSDGCSCDDMVSMEDFEALRESVRELQSSIGSMEADNNDLMDGMMEMATCMSGISDKYSSSTMAPTDEDRSSTSRRTTDSPTVTPSYKTPTPQPTAEWMAIATKLEKVDDNFQNKCGTQLVRNGGPRSFKLNFNGLMNCLNRCEQDDSCMFATVDHTSPDDETAKFCIGCAELTDYDDEWSVYKMNSKGRRVLSELEQLRAENAALKAELARRN